ncbi:MAG TPA: hypothetical protein VE262_01510 [Blastocatellia bacterium]|nr:hypothetical protein [Blastocatellia bacterium]
MQKVDFAGTSSYLAVAAAGETRLLRRVTLWFRAIAVTLGLPHAWAVRHAMNPDGISYLDMADAYMKGDWGTALNAQWSPMYSWILGLANILVKPGPGLEFPLVHFVNFLIYLAALAGFEYFMREMSRDSGEVSARPPEWVWRVVGYTLFIWVSLVLIPFELTCPDMIVACIVYVGSGLLLRIRRGHSGKGVFALLGLILAAGYLAKAPMFLLGFVFLLAGGFASGSIRKALPRVGLAGAVFLAACAPLIVALSASKGRFSFGESGRLNYAWYVNDVTRFVHWQGEGHGHGAPLHPTRKIHEAPDVYEFAAPIRATYPPWYDPSYWYEGVEPRFDLKGQARLLGSMAFIWWDIFINTQIVLIAMAFFLFYLAGRPRLLLKALARQWLLFAPALSAFAMYSLVNLEPRYVAPFVVLFWAGLFRAALSRAGLSRSRGLPARAPASAAVTLAVVLLLPLSASILFKSVQAPSESARAQAEVARALSEMGVDQGDGVGVIGDSFRAYWARLARVRIVAEIASPGPLGEIPAADADRFWTASEEVRARVLNIFANAGAEVIVADGLPLLFPGEGWQRIGQTGYYFYRLSP